MIDIINLSVYLENKPILKNINFSINEGEFVSIMGSNGSGKTTLVKTIALLIKKYEGEIKYFGKNIKTFNRKEFSKTISIFTPLKNFVPDFRVKEFVSFGREPYKEWYQFNLKDKKEENLILTALEKTNCIHLKNRKLSTLSSGEFQKVRLALILVQDSKVIILDEPITHLDLKTQEEFLNLLHELNKTFGKIIISVFHEINNAIKFSDKIIALKSGKIIFNGLANDIVNQKIIKEIFDINANILLDEKNGKKYILP